MPEDAPEMALVDARMAENTGNAHVKKVDDIIGFLGYSSEWKE